jgi:hypothetical protein
MVSNFPIFQVISKMPAAVPTNSHNKSRLIFGALRAAFLTTVNVCDRGAYVDPVQAF